MRVTGWEHRPKAFDEMLLIDWLAKVTNDSIVQGMGTVSVIGVGSHEDRRNRSPRSDEVSVELDPGHRRHMDIGDQAGRFCDTTGCEEIRCRWESLDGIAQRPHEPFHGLAKVSVILDDADQLLLHHAASGSSLEPAMPAAQQCRRTAWDCLTCGKNDMGAILVPRKLWLSSG
jgi:hypothetical protein